LETTAGIALFLLGSFGLIVIALAIPQVEFYTGGIFILLFIVGLLYIWGNAVRQSLKLEKNKLQESQVEASKQN
jgi:membrane-bound ClpP family serine protease